ncbi:hypothetical protein [Aminobacter carboxidus]|uniref:Uncharacterized protein n=1 Tax=Aminobacter carboxidus TaxID=376165 RepID=A0ABR9GVT6_9HYPH|nr:hypothetical protein [Aminobacter carboxidus]MBE1207797.1 hypothetical protein [Aminobacter carboxidus]
MFELLDELVLVEVLVEELVPELLWESLSVVQLPLEQLFERELDLLVDFETVTDLLPTRMRPSLAERAVRSPGADTIGAASAAETTATVARMLAAKANVPRPAMAPCSFPAGGPKRAAIRAFEHGRAARVNSPFGAIVPG